MASSQTYLFSILQEIAPSNYEWYNFQQTVFFDLKNCHTINSSGFYGAQVGWNILSSSVANVFHSQQPNSPESSQSCTRPLQAFNGMAREEFVFGRGQTNDKCSWSLFVSVTSYHDNTFYIIFILLCSSLSWKSNGLILNIVQSNFWFGVIGKCRLWKLYCIAKSVILHTLIGTSV